VNATTRASREAINMSEQQPTRRPVGRFEELDRPECMRLLAAKSVGRIAICDASGPVVVPVNYVFYDAVVLFRTSAHSTVAAHLKDAPASFQVDEVDDYLQSGWSVLVRGRAEYVENPEDLPHERFTVPEPWADGARQLYVRVVPDQFTGRRVHPV
jgi:uncharacterized protein